MTEAYDETAQAYEETTAPKHPPGLSPERLVFFTDAVLAIAITLLAIELPRPEGAQAREAGKLAEFLNHNLPSFIAFFLAFFLLWSIWRRHHALMDQLAAPTPGLIFWHAPLLLFVALLPFATSLVSAMRTNPLAVAIFALVEAGAVFCEAATKECARRSATLVPGARRIDIARGADASWAVGTFFVLSAVLAFVFPYVMYFWVLAPLAASYGGRLLGRVRRTPAAARRE